MHEQPREEDLTAYALGELDAEARAAVEAMLAGSADARREVEEVRATAARLRDAFASATHQAPTSEQRAAVEAEAAREPRSRRRSWSVAASLIAGVAASLVAVAVTYVPLRRSEKERVAGFHARMPPSTLLASPAQAYPQIPQVGRPPAEQLRSLGYIGGKLDGFDQEAAAPRFNYLQDSSADFNTEAYDHIRDNAFVLVVQDPRSTFSVDVDTASYSNVRRFLRDGQLPPKDAVRVEELINYFPYDYEPPTGAVPFAVHMETAACPWKPAHRLVRIGLKGREVPRAERPQSNLVFLIDISGSMAAPNKLPLVKAALRMLVAELRPEDRVAIVVYAGAEGLALPSTPAADKAAILSAIESLSPGGTTHGSAGIRLAYETAAAHFIEGGVNRVILATDGDFNVGVTSAGELVRLIEARRKSGVFLTALGFGMGNLKDATLEKLADHGNGNYAYIDSLAEARKVFVEQVGGTLVTIAKDVKLQVEFNPAKVKAFRLVGYENRVLAHQDFNDDTRDAGDIGAGHTVTALYEIVPPGVAIEVPGVDPLKYQPAARGPVSGSGELLTLKLRYKEPDSDRSSKLDVPVEDSGQSFDQASTDFRFAAAVAGFGMALRDSAYKGDASLRTSEAWARNALGEDEGGHRAELVSLIAQARRLAPNR
ncbi:MAG TPA: von Willebrand factor type A domain-containing protein [Vicinamibacteria bacterium]|nr:von Willebrand factor type A domain-containing protein [Vicinamibacteria bacterium]